MMEEINDPSFTINDIWGVLDYYDRLIHQIEKICGSHPGHKDVVRGFFQTRGPFHIKNGYLFWITPTIENTYIRSTLDVSRVTAHRRWKYIPWFQTYTTQQISIIDSLSSASLLEEVKILVRDPAAWHMEQLL